MKEYNYFKSDGKFWFEWRNGEEHSITVCSFSGCIKLARQFEQFGYKEGDKTMLDLNERSSNEDVYESLEHYGFFSDRWYKKK